MIIAELYDSIYPSTGFTSIRETVRGLVFKGDQVALIHIKCVDGFGERDHFEIPGGGIERGENQIEALHRELEEELGFKVEVKEKIGMIIDRWNLLERINVHHFYICEFMEFGEPNLTEYEQEVIIGNEWHTVDEWLEILNVPLKGVNELIHRRERIIFEEVQKKRHL